MRQSVRQRKRSRRKNAKFYYDWECN